MTVAPRAFLPAAQPRLPTADMLAPYLREIDEARWYSNRGPLVRRLEARLADHFTSRHDRPAEVLTVSSATMGLVLALTAAIGGRKGICLVPSWTFAATVSAVVFAGLTPYFVDVDADSWMLDLVKVERALATMPVVAIVAVAPSAAVAI